MRFLQRLPPGQASSFTPQQLAAMDLHLALRHRVAHAVDWRARLPFGLYAVLLIGRNTN